MGSRLGITKRLKDHGVTLERDQFVSKDNDHVNMSAALVK